MTTYTLSKHTIQNGDKTLTSYDIEFEENGIMKRICDISTDFDAISEFVDRLNRGGADSIHIYELIEDFILGL